RRHTRCYRDWSSDVCSSDLKVNLRGQLAGVEALVRWQHPERGLIPPDRFIALAEHTGLMRPLTHWVLATALRQARAWLDRGQPRSEERRVGKQSSSPEQRQC